MLETIILLVVIHCTNFIHAEECTGVRTFTLPQVHISFPGINTEVLYYNDTDFIISNIEFEVNLTCSAGYPVQWVESYGENSDGFYTSMEPPTFGEGDKKYLWNSVEIIGNFSDDLFPLENTLLENLGNSEISWTYSSVLYIKQRGVLCSVSNFSCQIVGEPCSQSNVYLQVNENKHTVEIKLSRPVENDGKFPVIRDELATSTSPYGPCEAIVQYSFDTATKEYVWQCQIPSTKEVVTGESIYTNCDSAAHCNSFYHKTRRGKSCVEKKDEKECLYCLHMNGSYTPGFVNCKSNEQGMLLSQHYFYSVPQAYDDLPEIYFEWSDADPDKMLSIQLLASDTFINDTVQVVCQVSRYYFSYGHRFATGYENGSVFLQEADDGTFEGRFHVNRMSLLMLLDDQSLNRIYCLAPVWNSTKWINKSISINIRRDVLYPKFLDGQSEYVVEKVNVGKSNASLTCSGFGQPIPSAEWINMDNKSHAYYVQKVNTSTSIIFFPHIMGNLEGDYYCKIHSYLGSSTRIYHLTVIDPAKRTMKFLLLVSMAVVLACTTIILACWMIIRRQKRQLQLLSEAELKEFLDGNIELVNANDYLDTTDLIQSLPYNQRFEIPKEMIRIDETKILGSGHFGQVLKGSIELLKSSRNHDPVMKSALRGMNSIDVAVKTVKQEVEVMYFKSLLSEVKIMAHIGTHPNIVSLVGACTQNIRKREIFIAVEFCHNGSLEIFLRKARSTFVNLLSDDQVDPSKLKTSPRNSYENVTRSEKYPEINTSHLFKWSREIANGMEFLGSKKIIHGDLAARNVFINEDLVSKIGDFGLSRQLLQYANYTKFQENCPLPWKWMSIEALESMKFSVSSDIWSYGVTLWEIFTLANNPYPGVIWSPDFLDQLINGMRMHKPSFATEKIYGVMLDCWNLDPIKRPSFTVTKQFFEKTLVAFSSNNYFQPRRSPKTDLSLGERDLPFTATARSTTPTIMVDEFSPDSGIAEDNHGYLVPLVES